MLQVLQESIRNFIADIGINGLGAENDQQQEPGNDGEQFDDEFDWNISLCLKKRKWNDSDSFRL